MNLYSVCDFSCFDAIQCAYYRKVELSQTADFWGHVDGNQWNRVDGKLVPQRRQFGTKKIENSAIIRG